MRPLLHLPILLCVLAACGGAGEGGKSSLKNGGPAKGTEWEDIGRHLAEVRASGAATIPRVNVEQGAIHPPDDTTDVFSRDIPRRHPSPSPAPAPVDNSSSRYRGGVAGSISRPVPTPHHKNISGTPRRSVSPPRRKAWQTNSHDRKQNKEAFYLHDRKRDEGEKFYSHERRPWGGEVARRFNSVRWMRATDDTAISYHQLANGGIVATNVSKLKLSSLQHSPPAPRHHTHPPPSLSSLPRPFRFPQQITPSAILPPIHSAAENIQSPDDVTSRATTEADNFPRQNLSEDESLASGVISGDVDMYISGKSAASKGQTVFTHRHPYAVNTSVRSQYIKPGNNPKPGILNDFNVTTKVTSAENVKHTSVSHGPSPSPSLPVINLSPQRSRRPNPLNQELRRQSGKILEDEDVAIGRHAPGTSMIALKGGRTVKRLDGERDERNGKGDSREFREMEDGIWEDKVRDVEEKDGWAEDLATLQGTEEAEHIKEENPEENDGLSEIDTDDEGNILLSDLPVSLTRRKRGVITPISEEEEGGQRRKGRVDGGAQVPEGGPLEDLTRVSRWADYDSAVMDASQVRHGRERLSFVRKKVSRNQTRTNYKTLSPTRYYNIFIKNFPQIFENYHSRLQHSHTPTKWSKHAEVSLGHDTNAGEVKGNGGPYSSMLPDHPRSASTRPEKSYIKTPQRHARSRNRSKRKATTREVWTLAGDDTLLPCDLAVRNPRDALQMVMWFREGSHTPFFSVDFREGEGGRPQIWRDNSSSTARRARLHPAGMTGGVEAKTAQWGRQNYYYGGAGLGNRFGDLDTVGRKLTDGDLGFGGEEEEGSLEGGEEEEEEEEVGGLIIEGAEVSDAAVYRCRVDFLLMATRNVRVNLTVVVPPASVGVAWLLDKARGSGDSGEVGPFKEGDSPTLICYTRDAWPPPRVVWLDEDVVVDNSYVIDDQNEAVVNSMTVLNVTRAHHLRRYVCVAANSNLTRPVATTVRLQVSLDVLGVRMNKVGPLSAGSRAEVKCTVWGSNPPAEVTWTLGDKTLPAPNTWVSDDGNRSVSMVSFTPQPHDDGVQLACEASNPIMAALNPSALPPPPSHTDSQLLDVNYVPRVAVSLGRSLDADNIKEGDDVYFECSAIAKPSPHRVTWSHNGAELRAEPGVLVSNMTLVLQKVSRGHAGTYVCHATNLEGTAASPPLHLDVKYAPVCASPVASQHSVAKHENAIISCNVLANPPVVQFSWAFNNTAEAVSVPEDRYAVEGTESVVNYTPMTELDYGTLLCWAQNEIGVQGQPCLFQIVAAGKPDPPHNCRAYEVTISSLQVSCLPGDDGGLGQTFLLQVVEVSGDQDPVAVVKENTASFSVANLRPATAYRLFITASNAKGESHPAELRAYTVALNHPQHETPAEPTRGRETGSEVAVGVVVGAVLACSLFGVVVVAMGVRTCLKLRASRCRRWREEGGEKEANAEGEGVTTGRPLLPGQGTPGSCGGLSVETGSDITTITAGVGMTPSLPTTTPSPGQTDTQVRVGEPGSLMYPGGRVYVANSSLDVGPQLCPATVVKQRRGPMGVAEDGDNELLEITLPPPAAYDQGYQSPSHRYQLGAVQGYPATVAQAYHHPQPRGALQGYQAQDQVHPRLKQGYQQGYEEYQTLPRGGQSSGYPLAPGQPTVHYISPSTTQDFRGPTNVDPSGSPGNIGTVTGNIGSVTGPTAFVGLPVTSKDSNPDASRVPTSTGDAEGGKMAALYNPLVLFAATSGNTTNGSPPPLAATFRGVKCPPGHGERNMAAMTGSLKRPVKPQGQDVVRLKDNNSLSRNRSASLSSVRGKRESSV